MTNNRILIIDDDLDILETAGALLEYEGFEIHSADRVEWGIEMIEEVLPLVIILDVMFPAKKTLGFEAAETIKNIYPNIPVFLVTSINREYAFNFTQNDVKVEEFINKPVDYENLTSLIKKYM